MPRKPRIHAPGLLYHVILRGNNRQNVFFRDADYVAWESLLVEALDRYSARLHCYCWMTNHVHFVAQVGETPLGAVVRHAATRYSRNINLMQGRTGHLFERRHRAIVVTEDRYLMGLVRYIHANPVRAGLVTDVDEYRWSSHQVYAGFRRCGWLATDTVLQAFGKTQTIARRNYLAFMGAHVEDDLSRYRQSADEPPARGTDARGADKTNSRHDRHRQSPALEEIVRRHLQQAGLTEAQLTGPSRCRAITRVRTDIAVAALREGSASLAGLARRLNRSESALCQAVTARKKSRGQ
jgi:REP element-mobilizing transposase RayT